MPVFVALFIIMSLVIVLSMIFALNPKEKKGSIETMLDDVEIIKMRKRDEGRKLRTSLYRQKGKTTTDGKHAIVIEEFLEKEKTWEIVYTAFGTLEDMWADEMYKAFETEDIQNFFAHVDKSLYSNTQ